MNQPSMLQEGQANLLELDLNPEKCHARFEHGDLACIITWHLQTMRPCMVLIPGRFIIISNTRTTPVLIRDTTIWAWSEEIGVDWHVTRATKEFCEPLGMSVTLPNMMRIFEIISTHIDDLILCPPRPRFDTHVAALTKQINRQTGEVTEGEIMSDA